jgi:hypothetical protein
LFSALDRIAHFLYSGSYAAVEEILSIDTGFSGQSGIRTALFCLAKTEPQAVSDSAYCYSFCCISFRAY